MTVRLRETLREATNDLPSYPVYQRALATARRTRRRSAAASAAVVILLAALVWTVPLPQVTDTPASAGSGALPDQVVIPPAFSLQVTDPFPLGAAAVAFSGMGGDEDGTVGVVSADTDRYRVLHVGVAAPAGEEVLLSPDGKHLAYQSDGMIAGPQVGVVNLTNRSVKKVPAVADGSLLSRPLGWSRDGRRLVVVDTVPVDAERSEHRQVLSLVELATGAAVHLATTGNTDSSLVPGYAVAFAPDNQRLALQIDDTVIVTDLVGTPGPSFRLPADTVLAGKGAWTPDGRALTVVNWQDDGWTLSTIDPTTGAGLADLDLPAVSGVTAIRLLGWGPDGSALVVAYQPNPRGVPSVMGIDQRTSYGHVHTVRLLSLTPAAAPVTRMTAPDEVRAVDVADNLIAAGRTRVADPPQDRFGPRIWFWLVVGLAVVAVFFGRRWHMTR
ncbi:MAG TPA: hypothetical protein VFX61_14935 [Micromonosporaceae bacterium]|nr:hypothetical protein [Micromonosporaceae bacterium]